MHHRLKDRQARGDAWRKFLDNNPPRMPKDFTHSEYKRIVSYARVAFLSGFYSGMNYLWKDLEE